MWARVFNGIEVHSRKKQSNTYSQNAEARSMKLCEVCRRVYIVSLGHLEFPITRGGWLQQSGKKESEWFAFNRISSCFVFGGVMMQMG